MLKLIKDNKKFFLSYLFATGIGDGLFFIGVGKILSTKLNLFLGVSLLFILNEVSKILFQFIFSSIDKKLSMKKAIVFSEIFQSIFLISVVIFSFDIFSSQILILSLIILNFFDGLSKIAEFNLTLKIFSKDDRKKFNSYITTINQSSRIIGFIIGGVIINNSRYELLFLLNSFSFLISCLFASLMKVEDTEITVRSSWKELLNKENYYILIYTFLIGTNTIILSSNSILGFNLSVSNTSQTILYQIANAIGSTIAALIISNIFKKMNKNENKIILLGITLQGILFFFFNLLDEYEKVVVFILISTISFINLSIYITKLQDYAETKFGSKAYPLRQLSRSILNLFGVTSLTYLAFTFKINYQTIVSFFCFFVVIINIFLIKNKIITYIVEN